MDYDGLHELVMKRRMIRRFKTDPIPDEYIEKMIEIARFAPSACNIQATEYIVVKKKEIRDKIVEYFRQENIAWHHLEWTRPLEDRFPRLLEEPKGRFAFANAPVFIIVCGDMRAHDIEPKNVQVGYMPYVIYSDLAIAAVYIHLAAATLGLATHWVSSVAEPHLEVYVKDILGVPTNWQLFELIAVGFPAAAPRPRYVRPREELIHYDQLDKSRVKTDKQMKEYIAKIREWWAGGYVIEK